MLLEKCGVVHVQYMYTYCTVHVHVIKNCTYMYMYNTTVGMALLPNNIMLSIPEALEEQFLADITEGQSDKGLPSLG